MNQLQRSARRLAAWACAALPVAAGGAQDDGVSAGVVSGYVVDVLQKPCPAARVEFFTADGERPVLRTTADGSGAFRRAGLPLGRLSVRATTDRGRGEISGWVTLTVAEPSSAGLRCVVEETHRVTGRVTDAAGRPLAGIAIVAARDYDELDRAVSDAKGGYELAHVALGDVVLRAWHPEHGLSQCPVTVLCDTRRDLSLDRGGGTLRIVFKGRGDALDAAARRSLWIRPGYWMGPWLQRLPEGLHEVTAGVGGDGVCTLRGLPAGMYGPEVGSTAYPWSRLLETLTLKEGETHEVEVEVDQPPLGPAIAVRGTVTDAEGIPMANLELVYGTASFTTDATGGFVLPEPRLEGSTVQLQALDPTWTLGDRWGVTCRVETDPLRLCARRAAAVTGRVTTADGLPADGVLVWIIEPETDRGVGYTETDSDGRYLLGHLAPAPAGLVARVQVSLGAGRPLGAGLSAPLDPLVAGVVRAGADVALQRPGAITGHAMTGDGVPVAGAWAVVSGGADSGFNQRVRTDRSGYFRMIGLGPGSYEVHIRVGTGFGHTLGKVEDVTVERGASTDVHDVLCEPRE